MPAQPSTWPCNRPVCGHAHLAVAALSQQARLCWTLHSRAGLQSSKLRPELESWMRSNVLGADGS